ncbi:MAG: 50S ribosomal protein L18 [Acidobacteriota bacterium]
MKDRTRRQARQRTKYRIRKKLCGTAERPRLCVFRSLKHVHAQVIDDGAGRTLISASSQEKEFPGGKGQNRQAATELGKLIARRSLEKGIDAVVFDRNGFKYHGRVKALADGAREGGLKF